MSRILRGKNQISTRIPMKTARAWARLGILKIRRDQFGRQEIDTADIDRAEEILAEGRWRILQDADRAGIKLLQGRISNRQAVDRWRRAHACPRHARGGSMTQAQLGLGF